MRRKDRDLPDRDKLIEIVEKADVCRIAINGDRAPYIVPLNFGYKWEDRLEIYFHCATEGKKLELLSKNNSVGFEFDIDHELVKDEKACNWGMKYKSIVGIGNITEITDVAEKKSALNSLMNHYGLVGKNIDFDLKIFNKTKVLKLEVSEMTGKQKV